MDKNSAISLIEETLNKEFNEEKFTFFIRNLLNDLEQGEKVKSYSGNYIWDDYKDHINSYKRIGKYTDPDQTTLDVLIVEVKTVLKLDRARTALRNFVIKHLSKFEKDHALVAFYSKEDDGADWRFSYVKLEYRSEMDFEKNKVKTKREFTPAKRFSFLVGINEKTHTATKQLVPLLQEVSINPTIDELEHAFSIEKVTDEFFSQYKQLYLNLLNHFKNDDQNKSILEKEKIDADRFTKKLLGQIVFLYFLQKKGWLGVPKEEKWGKGNKRYIQQLFDDAENEGSNFFQDKLQYLFYEALAKERNSDNSYYPKFKCRIPFLNGGLFEADYDWENAGISIPSTFFINKERNKSGDIGTGILDVFNRYNFTIKEDEPLDKEVAVDPEMLGKVFENMLPENERKGKGAFYTPREIVHYMCQESLIHYLDNALNYNSSAYQTLDSDQLTFLDKNTNKKGNLKLEIEHKNEVLVPKKDIELFIREGHFSLEHDLRVQNEGKETDTYAYRLPESIRKNAEFINTQLSNIKICDPAIGSGAFPLGLLHELVNAMLVLKPYFSSKYLEEKHILLGFSKNDIEINESRYIYRLKRHIIQESIYGVDIDASAIDIARLRLWLSLVVDEDNIDPLETLPNLDYKIVCGNSLIGFPEGWNSPVFQNIERIKSDFYDETSESAKKQLKYKIESEINDRLNSSKRIFGYQVNFDFKLFFSEVWREKGGFDIVIGNPPYVNVANIDNSSYREFLKINYTVSRNKSDLYSFFTEKGISLTKKNGILYFIVSNSWLGIDSFLNFRKFLVEKTTVLDLVKCKGNVFDASVTPVIYGLMNKKSKECSIPLKKLVNKNFTLTGHTLNYYDIKKLPSYPFSFEPLIILNNCPYKLGQIAHFTLGIKTSNDKRFISDEKIDRDSFRLIRGKDVERFKINYKDKWIWYKPNLMKEKMGAGPRNPSFFQTTKKIVIKDVANKIEAAIDTNKFFTNDTLNSIYKIEKYSFEFFLVILNSDVVNAWYSRVYSSGLHIKLNELKQIPIPNCTISALNIIDQLVQYCKILESSLSLSYFLELLNCIAYELYFPEELNSTNKAILINLVDLRQINSSMGFVEKLDIIQSEFERLYDPNHPVRNALETLDSIEEVRIIKEALKY